MIAHDTIPASTRAACHNGFPRVSLPLTAFSVDFVLLYLFATPNYWQQGSPIFCRIEARVSVTERGQLRKAKRALEVVLEAQTGLIRLYICRSCGNEELKAERDSLWNRNDDMKHK